MFIKFIKHITQNYVKNFRRSTRRNYLNNFFLRHSVEKSLKL